MRKIVGLPTVDHTSVTELSSRVATVMLLTRLWPLPPTPGVRKRARPRNAPLCHRTHACTTVSLTACGACQARGDKWAWDERPTQDAVVHHDRAPCAVCKARAHRQARLGRRVANDARASGVLARHSRRPVAAAEVADVLGARRQQRRALGHDDAPDTVDAALARCRAGEAVTGLAHALAKLASGGVRPRRSRVRVVGPDALLHCEVMVPAYKCFSPVPLVGQPRFASPPPLRSAARGSRHATHAGRAHRRCPRCRRRCRRATARRRTFPGTAWS